MQSGKPANRNTLIDEHFLYRECKRAQILRFSLLNCSKIPLKIDVNSGKLGLCQPRASNLPIHRIPARRSLLLHIINKNTRHHWRYINDGWMQNEFYGVKAYSPILQEEQTRPWRIETRID